MGPQGVQLFALGAGWAVGLVFSIAAIGGLFSIAGRVQKRLKRGRKCRFCDYQGGRIDVVSHEAKDHVLCASTLCITAGNGVG
jgi:hypothetical protein